MAIVAWCRAPRNRWVIVAAVVGLVLRVAWCTWLTQAPSGATSDPAQYLQMARGFASGDMPNIDGRHTAFAPPGYSMLLAPFSLVSEATGWFSLEYAASLLNAVAGTLTILGVALLAGWWIGPKARAPAAWLLALAPGQIYVTSVVLTETLFTFLLVAGLVLLTWLLVRARPARRSAWLVGVGVLVGYATLVRSPGLLLLAVPALVLKGATGSWRGSLRPTLLLLAGALVLLVPWGVRNAVQVGVWSPLSTNNAAFLCTGHSPYADGTFDDSEEGLIYCYRGSPFDPEGADEAEWYRRISIRALEYAVENPGRELQLAGWKTWYVWRDDAETLENARDFGAREIASERVTHLLADVATAWYFGVLALAAAGLALVPACRRAWPVWGLILGQALLVYGGIGLSRYHHPMMPLFVVLAAGAIARMRAGPERESAEVAAPEPSEVESDRDLDVDRSSTAGT